MPVILKIYDLAWHGMVSILNLNYLIIIVPKRTDSPGGSFDPMQPIPIDGFDVWKTISRGDPSPRTEILLNIDNSLDHKEGDQTLGLFQGMALRMGDMKLLVNVPNVTWFKPPEMGGIPAERVLGKRVGAWLENLVSCSFVWY